MLKQLTWRLERMKVIELTKGAITTVSDEDFEYLSQFNWCVGSRKYTVRRRLKADGPGPNTIYIHRVILKRMGVDTTNLCTDHINRDRTDNRRENLRAVTNQENSYNSRKHKDSSSIYKGVHLDRGVWRAKICHNSKQIHLGRYETQEEAANAYDTAAKELFGEYAALNSDLIDI